MIRYGYSYVEALTEFEAAKNTHKTPPENINYYLAITRLGLLLNSLREESKAQSETSIFQQLAAKKSEFKDSKSERSPSHRTDNISEEIASILAVFQSAKKGIKAKKIPGVEYAIKTFIPELFRLNENTNKHRTKQFAAAFAKFKLLYSVKPAVSDNLVDVDQNEEWFMSRLFLSEPIKKLKNIINDNKEDLLFLSEEQLLALYKLLATYQYDKKYQHVIDDMKRQLFLSSYLSSKDKLSEFWNKYTGDITIDKVILLKSIYSDHTMRDLAVIISELNGNQLLSDDLFPCLHALAFPAQDFYQNLKMIEEVIVKIHAKEKNQWLLKLFGYALDQVPHKSIPEDQFISYISFVKKSCITASGEIDTQKIYSYLDLLTILTKNKNKKISLTKVVSLMQQVEKLLGGKNFAAITQRVLQYKMSNTDFIAVLNLAMQLREESVKDLLHLMDVHHHDIDTFRHELSDLIARDYQAKFPERSLDEVTHDFLTQSQDVEFNLEAEEFGELKAKYLRIKAIGDTLIILGDIGIESSLNDCKAQLRKNPADIEAQLTLLAIIRLQVKNQFGINPYNVQMLNVLALLNQPKRIAQIKTGEGKSTLISIMAAYHGVMGRRVDIVTTSHDLALRDSKKFKDFYQALGLTVAQNANEHQDNNSNCYNQDIVYGTVSDFEFAYLRKETGSSHGRGDRPYDVVIADEVDSMCIDMQRNEAILSQATESTHKAEVYQYIWHWINKTDRKDHNKENLQAMLKAKSVEVSLELASTWLKSARTAKLYADEKEYVVGYPELKTKNKKSQNKDRVIKIVNKSHTGEVQSESSRWQGGLHEILEAKHGLEIHAESLTSASISHIEFFNKYNTLVGLTGTLGSEACRDELQQLYHVSTYDSPPYKPSLKKPVPHIIAKDLDSQNQNILHIVKQQVKSGRPVLILCESIKESKELYERLSKEIKSVEIYNGVQHESAETILGLAGNPGAVTIATNVAGRGTDIVVTPEAEDNGGLHVLMTFPAINRRVEQQAFGRTGRQGRHGTFQYVLREDQLSAEENAFDTVEEKIQYMSEIRERREKHVSQINLFNYNLMHKLFILQCVFFSLPEQMKLNTLTPWATFKTSAHKYVVQYLRNELEEINEDDIFQDVLDEFDEFWQKIIATRGQHFLTPEDFIKSRLKQPFADPYTKNLLVQALVLLENPKFDFSTEVADLFVDLRAAELSAEMASEMENNHLMRFYQSKADSSEGSSSHLALRQHGGSRLNM